ncbi:MAG: glycosyltransferase family 2 protein [Proteobacteria bacterium]|nr:glycosyltransferase family 2 protein [Pseudomonadota bacterium]
MRNAIALVLIARNEERCIARCLDSARAHVDEMIVLDTGSTDATREIAARCGARVLSAAWPDDFSAARNLALSHTDAPWRLVLDADEWIAAGAESLGAIRARAPGFLGLLRVDSVVNDERGALQHAPSWMPRLLPAGVHYEGRIHEQPAGALPRERLALVIGHDGYLDQARAAKAGRNERLLRMALAEHPGDAYLHYQLGKDLEVRARFAEALPHYLEAHRAGEAAAAWRHDLVVRLIFTLKKLKQFAEAVELASHELERWSDSPDFFFTLGDLLLDWALAEPQRAAELLPQIEASWQRAVAIGERPELPDSVRGRGSFLAAHNLAAFHESLGQAAQAAQWREREARWRAASAGQAE